MSSEAVHAITAATADPFGVGVGEKTDGVLLTACEPNVRLVARADPSNRVDIEAVECVARQAAGSGNLSIGFAGQVRISFSGSNAPAYPQRENKSGGGKQNVWTRSCRQSWGTDAGSNA